MDIWRALRYGGTRLGLVAFAVAPVLLSDGARLTSRAEIKSAHETAQLEEAVTPIVTPLKEFTREHEPLRWAASLGNQGVVMILVAGRTRNATMARWPKQRTSKSRSLWKLCDPLGAHQIRRITNHTYTGRAASATISKFPESNAYTRQSARRNCCNAVGASGESALKVDGVARRST
jgi:hypothetical protein